jgi:deoxyribodipyrimidine photolyase-related protein
MSNYCAGCQYKPEVRFGEQACPVTTLYWHFLIKHQAALNKNPRSRLMTANLSKISDDDQAQIQSHAQHILNNMDAI